MCGIHGVIGLQDSASVPENWLTLMGDVQPGVAVDSFHFGRKNVGVGINPAVNAAFGRQG